MTTKPEGGDGGDDLARIDAAIARGLADAEAGWVTSAEAVFDRLEAKYWAMPRTGVDRGGATGGDQ
ncbi:hypothetical protein [Sphingomonas sp. Leaf10]|uniref:hypothetical protein n=1 Tax=Sphingomonas sp. Leaf10 TaxID=1735676 RepID=UPI0006F4A79A|nr:hypothetical protein [Sphingomonas sp. Leaf10]KQM36583.1 hypothetical protein ASE59_14885 [Sphingomonas sp. Leaf10]